MKKQLVTLESLDKKVDKIDAKFESKITVLNGEIKKERFNREKVFADMEQRLRKFKSETRTTMELIDFRFNELMDFLKEYMLLKGDIERIIDAKFIKYTSDQFEFQDRVGKRCENNEFENLALHHRVTRIEKRIGI